jgi:hypothetical protein
MDFDQDKEQKARDFYWKRNPEKMMAENSRPDLVVGFVAGFNHALTLNLPVRFAVWLSHKYDIGYDNGQHFYMNAHGDELDINELYQQFLKTIQ